MAPPFMSPHLTPLGCLPERRYSIVPPHGFASFLFSSPSPKLPESERVGFVPFVFVNVLVHHIFCFPVDIFNLSPPLGLWQVMKWGWEGVEISLLKKEVLGLEGI